MRIGIKRTHSISGSATAHTHAPAAAIWARPAAELVAVATMLALAVLLATWFSQPSLRIHVAEAAASRYLSGFWAVEHSDDVSFRWSKTEATIRLFGLEQRAPVLFQARLSASRKPGEPLAQLLLEDGKESMRFPIRREWRRYMTLLPAPPRDAEGRVIMLRSLVDPPHDDSRDLGLALDWFAADQLPRTPLDRLPTADRLAFLVVLGLLGYAALRRTRVPPQIRLLVTLVIVITLGSGLLAAPAVLAYWLPNLWLLALAGWMALLLPKILPWLRQRQSRITRVAALVAVGAGVALLPLHQPWSGAAGWALLLGGAILLSAALPALPAAEAHPLSTRSVALALAAITLLALALRLPGLDTLPLGMWRDEARHGLLALRILNDRSYRPIYVPNVADIPALLFYLAAVPIKLFGAHPWTIRLIPALAGALTPLALYFAARPLFGTRAALIAATLMAISVWQLSLSRLAFAATLGPPLTLLAVGLVWRALRPNSTPVERSADRPPAGTGINRAAFRFFEAALAGAATGLAIYTYHPSRLTPLIVAIAIALRLGWNTSAWRAAVPRLALLGIAATLVAWPLISYGITHRASFGQRIGQTSIFTSDSIDGRAPLARVEENVGLNLGIWNERGDRIGRHNLPDAPMLDPLTGAAFVIGAGLILTRLRDRRALLLALWMGVALVPGIFSIEAPHAVRTVEAIAPTMLLAAIGIAALATATGDRRPTTEPFEKEQTSSAGDQELPARFASVSRMLSILRPLVRVQIGGEQDADEADERRRAAFFPRSSASSASYLRNCEQVRLPSKFALPTVLVIGLLLAALTLNSVRYFVAWPVSPQAYEEFFVAETHAGEVIQRLVAQPEIQSGTYKIYVPDSAVKNDVVRYLTSGIPLETFAHGRLATPAGDHALLIDIGDQASDPQELAHTLGAGAMLLASGPISPTSGRPEWTIYGRGPAATQAVARALAH